MVARQISPVLLTLAIAASCGSSAHAADAPTVVQPVPLTQEGRFFPAFANEAFVITRYTVKADGSTADFEIVGGFGADNPFFENSLKDSVAKWTYTPGTVNGEPADFLN